MYATVTGVGSAERWSDRVITCSTPLTSPEPTWSGVSFSASCPERQLLASDPSDVTGAAVTPSGKEVDSSFSTHAQPAPDNGSVADTGSAESPDPKSTLS